MAIDGFLLDLILGDGIENPYLKDFTAAFLDSQIYLRTNALYKGNYTNSYEQYITEDASASNYQMFIYLEGMNRLANQLAVSLVVFSAIQLVITLPFNLVTMVVICRRNRLWSQTNGILAINSLSNIMLSLILNVTMWSIWMILVGIISSDYSEAVTFIRSMALPFFIRSNFNG